MGGFSAVGLHNPKNPINVGRRLERAGVMEPP